MSEKLAIKEQQSAKATKAFYVTPRLHVYGNVEKITKAGGNRGGDGAHLGHSR